MTLDASFGTEFPLNTTRNVPVELDCALGALMMAIRPATNASTIASAKRLPRIRVPLSGSRFGHSTGGPEDGQSRWSMRHAEWPSRPCGAARIPRDRVATRTSAAWRSAREWLESCGEALGRLH